MKRIVFLFLIISTTAYAEEQQTVQIPMEQAQVINQAVQKGTERVIKFADNHGKIQRILKTNDGQEVVISEFSFGADFVYQSIAKVEADLAKFSNQKWIDAQIENLQAQKAKILHMKAVLEGETAG